MQCMKCGRDYLIPLCPECARASHESIGKAKKALGTKTKQRAHKGKNPCNIEGHVISDKGSESDERD